MPSTIPKSPLDVKYIPDIYVKREGLADILWKAGVACYGIPVTTAGRVHRESTKNVYSLLRKIRLTSYVGLNAGIVYNSDPTSRISNFLKPCGSTVDVWSMTVGHVLSFV